MHINRGQMNLNSASLYSAAGAEKAASAQRAAEVRKKLLKNASNVERSTSPEETLMIGQWLNAGHSQVRGEDEYHAGASGKESDFR